MSINYRNHYSVRETPQTERVPGRSDQVQNRSGGMVFSVDQWKRLERFATLGTWDTYYANAKELTVENADMVMQCIKEDGSRVVDMVVDISESGRAVKNDPALFVLAMCAGADELKTRQAALKALPKVARIGTHLFTFAEYIEGFRGWGRSLRKAVAAWYSDKELESLVYQAIKYQQRGGWSHRDLLRLSHPSSNGDQARQAVYRWIVSGMSELGERKVDRDRDKVKKVYESIEGSLPQKIKALEQLKKAETKHDVLSILNSVPLPWEAVPTQWLGEKDVWKVLLPRLPMTATLRNLGRLTANEVLKPMSKELSMVIDRLTQEEWVRKARIHPLSVLMALKTYQRGQGGRGSLTWYPNGQLVDALDAMFYISFGNVEPTNKRMMLALDISGSMSWGDIAGMRGITPRDGSAAMSLVTAATERNYCVMGFGRELIPLSITPTQRLDDVIRTISDLPFGGTDCSLPMVYALKQGLEIDAFIIYTDNETWAGRNHPFQALQRYRSRMNIPAKMVTVGMTSNGFTIADPTDSGMLDCVGFDTATPNVISNFVR